MKKLLFTTFYTVVALLGISYFSINSKVYANQPQCNFDITTNSAGTLQGNTCIVGNSSNLTNLVP